MDTSIPSEGCIEFSGAEEFHVAVEEAAEGEVDGAGAVDCGWDGVAEWGYAFIGWFGCRS